MIIRSSGSVIELGVELAGPAAAVGLIDVIDVLVAGDAALVARLVLDEVRLLHGTAVQAGWRVVALRPEIGFRQGAQGMETGDVAPGAAGAVGLFGVAVIARALTAADFLVGLPHRAASLPRFRSGAWATTASRFFEPMTLPMPPRPANLGLHCRDCN